MQNPAAGKEQPQALVRTLRGTQLESSRKGPEEVVVESPVGHRPAMHSSVKTGQQNPESWAVLDQVLSAGQRRI